MKRYHLFMFSICLGIITTILVLAGADHTAAGVLQSGAPTVVSYQGQVTVGGSAYSGEGYFKVAVVNQAGDTTYWSNDGSSTGGNEPTSAVQVTVDNSLFNLLLGDTSLTNMASLPASVFDGTERYLRVWFSSDGTTFALLSPDQRIAAVPYALQAEEAKTASTGPFWNLSGNASTTAGTHFLGTSDNVALELRVNNARVLRLEPFAGGTPNIIGGYSANYAASGVQGATVAGGGGSSARNRVTDNFGAVGGGRNNQAGSDDGTLDNSEFAIVGGGRANTADGEESVVGGGYDNAASALDSFVGGGSGNVVSSIASYGVVGGGSDNTADGVRSFVGGGAGNIASGARSLVGGGGGNNAGGAYAFIGGGNANVTDPITNYVTIVNGYQNTASGEFAFIGNGYHNNALGFRSVIVGGEQNTTHDWFGFIGGGDENEVWGRYSSISGGYSNVITGYMTTIGGGRGNTAIAGYSTISGGQNNAVSGGHTTISGGQGNTASGNFATVPGGLNAAATHYGEMAYASGSFTERGDAQTSVYVLRRTSTGSSQIQLYLDPGSSQQITLPISRTVTFDILIVAAADNGEAASYQYVGGIKRTAAGGTALIGSIQTLLELEDDGTWAVLIDADTANNALRIRVTGAAGRTIHWVATVRTVETTMP